MKKVEAQELESGLINALRQGVEGKESAMSKAANLAIAAGLGLKEAAGTFRREFRKRALELAQRNQCEAARICRDHRNTINRDVKRFHLQGACQVIGAKKPVKSTTSSTIQQPRY